jgi:hypothetical protein
MLVPPYMFPALRMRNMQSLEKLTICELCTKTQIAWVYMDFNFIMCTNRQPIDHTHSIVEEEIASVGKPALKSILPISSFLQFQELILMCPDKCITALSFTAFSMDYYKFHNNMHK